MSTANPTSQGPTASKTLRRLFLMLFLRGRTSRGLQKQSAPKSVGQKLGMAILFYAAFGCLAFVFGKQPIFALSVWLHTMTFVFLGMFVASAGGEVLFNKEEADILLHRPITPRTLLWAKVRMLVEISLWLAGALSLAGFFVGFMNPYGGWRYPLVHAASTILQAFFCTGCVIMVYQLCLRYFGRERLEGLMTAAQVIVSIAAVLLGQVVPQLMTHMGSVVNFSGKSWWVALLPPAWFAGFDDALAGASAGGSWVLAALAVTATAAISWIAFDKLAGDYESGLQRLSETTTRKSRKSSNRRWLDRMVDIPPLSWWLRDPVSRASFLLTAAYLVRDRDVKLRVYPSLAPILVVPLIGLMNAWNRKSSEGSEFQLAFAGAFIGVAPMLAINLLQYSQQWQASDIFRAAPMPGPIALCHGARRAAILFIGLPTAACLMLLVWLIYRDFMHLELLLPGIVAMPIFALAATLKGQTVPLSHPTEAAKSANRGVVMIVSMFVAMTLSGLAYAALRLDLFWFWMGLETIVIAAIYAILRFTLNNPRWSSME